MIVVIGGAGLFGSFRTIYGGSRKLRPGAGAKTTMPHDVTSTCPLDSVIDHLLLTNTVSTMARRRRCASMTWSARDPEPGGGGPR